MTVGRIFAKYIPFTKLSSARAQKKGRALLSSSLARATRVLGTAILMCCAVQLV